MLYFLLSIIAIGVLLASEAGKAILIGLAGLSVILGIIYICFLIVVFAIAYTSLIMEILILLLFVGIFIITAKTIIKYLQNYYNQRGKVVDTIIKPFRFILTKLKNFLFYILDTFAFEKHYSFYLLIFLVIAIIFLIYSLT